VNIAGSANMCPLSQERAFWAEDLDAPRGAIADVDEAFCVYGEGVGQGELAWSRVFTPPLGTECETRIKPGDAVIDVAI